jgi:hypothetical protein
MSQTIGAMRLLSLRARLDAHQQEKSRLLATITSSTTSPRQKQEASHRYSRLISDIREISTALGTGQGTSFGRARTSSGDRKGAHTL